MKQRASAIVLGVCIVCAVAFDAHGEEAPPPGIERLGFLVGQWDVRTHAIVEGEWAETRAETVEVAGLLEDKFLRFALAAELQGREFVVELTLAFDVARSVYRMTMNSSMMGYMDVYQGDFTDGVLRLSNEATGTGFPLDAGMQFARFDIRPGSADAWTAEIKFSADGGKTWHDYNRLYFQRPNG